MQQANKSDIISQQIRHHTSIFRIFSEFVFSYSSPSLPGPVPGVSWKLPGKVYDRHWQLTVSFFYKQLNRLDSDDLGQPKEPEKKSSKPKVAKTAEAGSVLVMILDPAAAV